MNSIQLRILAMFAAAALLAHAQVSSVQSFQIHVVDPAYTGFPAWIYAIEFPLEIYASECNQDRRRLAQPL